MQITVTTEEGGLYPLEVSTELTVGDLKALLEIEAGVAVGEMLLVLNMVPMLDDRKTLGDFNIENDDIIMMSKLDGNVNISDPAPLPQPPVAMETPPSADGVTLPQIDWSSIRVPGATSTPPQQHPPTLDTSNPETVRQHFLQNPYELSVLQARNPHLAEALVDPDPQRFRDALAEQTRAVREMERQRIQMMNADPLDPEYQSRIAQTIQQRNIQNNMEAALEYMPESFSRVVMLYLPIKVNGVLVKALVDSGARSTIMSERCAERCNIMRLVDRRFAGIAFGVGRQKIIGKVHLGQLQIGNDFLTSSFQVLQDQSEDMLLGLDMLRRHQCCIDLKNNVLKIGTTGNEAAFLSEADLKEKEQMEQKQAEMSMVDEDADLAKAIENSENEQHQGSSSQASGSSMLSQPSSSSAHIPRPSPPVTQQQQSSPSIPEASIARVVSAGFTREQAVQELRQCGGNVELTIASLVAKSIKF